MDFPNLEGLTGLFSVPVAIIGGWYTIVSVKKAQLESELLRIEIKKKSAELAPTVSQSSIQERSSPKTPLSFSPIRPLAIYMVAAALCLAGFILEMKSARPVTTESVGSLILNAAGMVFSAVLMCCMAVMNHISRMEIGNLRAVSEMLASHASGIGKIMISQTEHSAEMALRSTTAILERLTLNDRKPGGG